MTFILLLLSLTLDSRGDDLRVAVEGTYHPFNFLNRQGEPEGFDVDLGKEICSRMKAACEWVVQDFAGMIPGLDAKRFDLIISSMSITEKRKEKVAFSQPYYKAPAAYLGKKGETIIPPEFKGPKKVRIGVQRSSTYSEYLKSLAKPNIEIVLYDDVPLSVADLRVGRIHLVLCQYFVGKTLLSNFGNTMLEIKGLPLRHDQTMGDGAGIAARKTDTALIDRVNTALTSMKKDGTFSKIRSKHFQNPCEMEIGECK